MILAKSMLHSPPEILIGMEFAVIVIVL